MAAVHQTMATIHQSMPQPGHSLSVYGSHFVRPRPSPSPARRMNSPAHRHIWIVAGTSCCGKTTIANNLAKRLGAGDYIEGDDFHPPENRRKMSEGNPLTDADRAPWLQNLQDIAVKALQTRTNVVITCSALKKQYRNVFRQAQMDNSRIRVHFLFLVAPENILVDRAASRPGHFFKGTSMIKSQFAALEMPCTADEQDVMLMDCTKREHEVEANAWNKVQGILSVDRK